MPPALAADGPVIVLQPRRVAARSMAQRIAHEQKWMLGNEVGWQVRFERRFSERTRVLLATEGILTARLQHDPLLSDFRTVILDEFHERSIHADLGLALIRQAWKARDDLRVLVMSATLETDPVAAYLDGCPVLEVPGQIHPLTIDYRPDQTLPAAVSEMLQRTSGNVLCFLPGAPEIRRAEPDVRRAASGAAVLPLHGSLTPDEQDRALVDAPGRTIVLATNIAETSLTVPGVRCVIDTGVHKVARYDPDRGIDSLETERISLDSADQRAGRAGRLGPGNVRRLWDPRDRLRPHREAEIHRIDLSEPLLGILGWGGDPVRFEWYDPPSPDRIEAAVALLDRLGAIENGRLTPLGNRMQQLPVHPRLARMLIDGAGDRRIALACALLSERHLLAPRVAATASDLLSAVDDPRALPPHVTEIAKRFLAMDDRDARESAADSDERFLHAVFRGYPDRVARRRAPGSPRFLFATGAGGVIGSESGVHDAEFIVGIDVHAGRRGEGSEARIRMASAIDAAWLQPTRSTVEHTFDPRSGSVRALAREFYGDIPLRERAIPPALREASRVLADAYLARGLTSEDEQLVRRRRFAGEQVIVEELVQQAAEGKTRLSDVTLSAPRDLDRLAPAAIAVPSGRMARLEYQEDGTVIAAVKLQELFGLADSPRIGPRREPIVFSLLAPNGRPVQTTRDLRSFWNTTYQEVRKELRGRYPKHPWPDDPWTAQPTARTTRKKGG